MPSKTRNYVRPSNRFTAERDLESIADNLNKKLNSPLFLDGTSEKIEFVKYSLVDWKGCWLLVFDSYNRPNLFKVTEFFPASESVLLSYVT